MPQRSVGVRRSKFSGGTVASGGGSVSGLAFPGVTGDTAADWLSFGYAQDPGGVRSGLNTATAPMTGYPATFIRKVFNRIGSQRFYSWLFYAEDQPNNVWDPDVSDYYGAHPYNNADIIGPGGPREEISAGGGDETLYDDGNPATLSVGSFPPVSTADAGWRTQVFTARIVGGNLELIYHTNFPDTTSATTITFTRAQKGLPAHPILCMADAPWNRGKEIGYGILRGLQIYDAFLSKAEIISELATPGSVRTPWYLNLNPTPSDITDKSGNAHHPAWVNANRPTLWTP